MKEFMKNTLSTKKSNPKTPSKSKKAPAAKDPAAVLLAGYSALTATEDSTSPGKKPARSPKSTQAQQAKNTPATESTETPSLQPEDPSKTKALLCAKAAIDKNAENTKVLDLNGRSSLSDFFIICSGTSDRQVQAIADSVSSKMRNAGYKILSSEGYTEGRWLLMDYGDVIVHIFLDALREYYDLEALWQDAPQVKIPSEYYGPAASRLN